MLIDVMQLNPMLRLVVGFLCWAQITRRLVTTRNPRFPLLPFVSSTELIESISNSPLFVWSCCRGTSNRISRSCQISCM